MWPAKVVVVPIIAGLCCSRRWSTRSTIKVWFVGRYCSRSTRRHPVSLTKTEYDFQRNKEQSLRQKSFSKTTSWSGKSNSRHVASQRNLNLIATMPIKKVELLVLVLVRVFRFHMSHEPTEQYGCCISFFGIVMLFLCVFIDQEFFLKSPEPCVVDGNDAFKGTWMHLQSRPTTVCTSKRPTSSDVVFVGTTVSCMVLELREDRCVGFRELEERQTNAYALAVFCLGLVVLGCLLGCTQTCLSRLSATNTIPPSAEPLVELV